MSNTGAAASPDGKPLIQKILQKDVPASLVVFLVAVPLSLGIANASGAPIMAGLIAAVIGGIVVGLLGGSPLQVSGPAAGLTVVVFEIIEKFGWPTTCAIVVVAGLIQIVLGFLRIARAALVISPAVVHGMLAGIGVVIILAQLHVVLGDAPESSALKNIQALPGEIMNLHGASAFLGLLTIALLVAWQFVPKPLKLVPAPLVAVTVATIASLFLNDTNIRRIDLPSNLYADHIFPKLPESGEWHAFVLAALTIALIASVESLLSAVAVDKLHTGERSNLDKELIGQGAANTISGLMGGLPVTGVIVRSSTNVNSGAQTRVSAILHGVWILIFVVLLSAVLEKIPLAVLAGLLVFVGVRLIDPAHIRELIHHRESAPYFVTLLGVVFLNLLEGVAIGLVLSFILLLRRIGSAQVMVEEREEKWHIRIEGSATVLSVPNLTKELARVPIGAKVDVDLMVDFMDHAAFEAIHSWRVSHEKTGGSVDIDELHEAWYSNAETGEPNRSKSLLTAFSAADAPGRTGRAVEPSSISDADIAPSAESSRL